MFGHLNKLEVAWKECVTSWRAFSSHWPEGFCVFLQCFRVPGQGDSELKPAVTCTPGHVPLAAWMDWPCLCLGNVFQLPLRLGLCVESPATVEVKLHMVPLIFCCKGHILGFVKVFFFSSCRSSMPWYYWFCWALWLIQIITTFQVLNSGVTLSSWMMPVSTSDNCRYFGIFKGRESGCQFFLLNYKYWFMGPFELMLHSLPVVTNQDDKYLCAAWFLSASKGRSLRSDLSSFFFPLLRLTFLFFKILLCVNLFTPWDFWLFEGGRE